MSDTSLSTPSSAAPSPPPASPGAPATELPANFDPGRPQEVTNRPPERPDGGKPPAAEAKPPAPKPPEALSRRQALLDAKKAVDAKQAAREAADKAALAKAQPPHREQGKFAKAPDAQGRPPADAAAPDGQQQQPGQPGQQQPGQQQPGQQQPLDHYREAPRRWSEQARAEWAKAPESVRASVHHTIRELENGIAQYRAAAEEYEPVRPYAELARQHGTTVHEALGRYVGMENVLRTDLVGGLGQIVQNLGLRNTDGSPTTLRDIAFHVLNQSPEQLQLTSGRMQHVQQQNAIQQLTQNVAGLASTLESMQTAQRQAQALDFINQYAAQNPGFEHIAGDVLRAMEIGYSFEDAVEKCRAFIPATAAQTRAHPAQTRNGQNGGYEQPQRDLYRSTGGAPEGTPLDPIESGQKMSREEALRYALRRVAR